MRPVMVTRAIDPPGAPVNTLVPGARSAAPTATTAQMATRTARTRQKVSLRRIRRRSTMVSASSDIGSPFGSVLFFLVRRLFGRALERSAENVAERRAGIGGAVLGDRLLFLRHFERLDRHLHLVGATVELDDAGVDLLPDGEAFRPLLAAVARELGALDEGGEV